MIQRLLILSLVPETHSGRVDNIRRILCNESNSYASLQFPPHITLAHIKIPDGGLGSALKEIETISEKLRNCEVQVTGIDYHVYQERGKEQGKEKYTVRYAIEPNPQLVEVHQELKGLNDLNKSTLGGSRHHITLVFGDLTKENYIHLQQYILEHKELERKFSYTCDNLSVLVRDKGPWEIIRKFKV
jgi:hypothetical protein